MSIAGTYHEKALNFGGHLVVAVDIVSPVTYVDFGPPVLNDKYDSYVFELSELIPSMTSTHWAVVLSADGSSFPSSGLSWQRQLLFANGAAQVNGSVRNGVSTVWHFADYQYTTPYGLSGYIGFTKGPPGFANITPMRWLLDGTSTAQTSQMFSQGGGASVALVPKYIRFFYNGGNILVGKIRLYGLVK